MSMSLAMIRVAGCAGDTDVKDHLADRVKAQGCDGTRTSEKPI